MPEIRQFIDDEGKNLFERWFSKLDALAAAKVTVAMERLAMGNFSNVKAIGAGVLEYKLNWGPGYRIYFGKDGETLILLLTGGTKKRQSNDIAIAKLQWARYQEMKKREEE